MWSFSQKFDKCTCYLHLHVPLGQFIFSIDTSCTIIAVFYWIHRCWARNRVSLGIGERNQIFFGMRRSYGTSMQNYSSISILTWIGCNENLKLIESSSFSKWKEVYALCWLQCGCFTIRSKGLRNSRKFEYTDISRGIYFGLLYVDKVHNST